MAKRFFCISLGVLCLAAAYHLGSTQTEASGFTGSFVCLTQVGSSSSDYVALADTGEVYRIDIDVPGLASFYLGTITGGPVPLEQESWTKIKARYRE
jgi:hypothetical protein